jgi:uracil-DNA glycosylase family 4
VFIGDAGKEFNLTYLPLAGLFRPVWGDPQDADVYVTNARKCRQHNNKTPTYNEMIGCANHFIPHELKEVNPTYVVLMGASACKLLGSRGVDLESEHGIPRWGELYGWEGWIVPINHPAAGLHDGAMMTPMLEDWEKLGAWIQSGTWGWAEDTVKVRDYQLCRNPIDIDRYFFSYGRRVDQLNLLGLDTETQEGRRWSIQVSADVGTGIMIQTDDGVFDPDLLKLLRYWAEPSEWALHNAEADLWVATLLNLPNQPYRDTMQEAYQFQNLPQKLKALARRLLGRIRPGWDDLVTPHSKDKLHEWMTNGILHAESHWQQVIERKHKRTGKPLKPDVQKSQAESLLFQIMGHMLNNEDYEVWDKLDERIPEAWMERLVKAVGPMPRKGIAHVPIDEAVYYGCSDADDTLAIALLFDRMRKEFKAKLNVQEEDRDSYESHIYV